MRPTLAARCFTSRTALALALLALIAAASACGKEAAKEDEAPDERVVVMLSYEGMAYVEAGASTRKIAERLRQGTQSVLTTLRKADVMITSRKTADVDLAHLEKEPLFLVDPATGNTRAVTRLKHRVTMLGLVPQPIVAKGEMQIGLLHDTGGARAEAVLAACTANGEIERAALGELSSVFDATLPGCIEAMKREHEAIAAARKDLKRPEKEIVPIEMERAYVPLVVTLSRRHAVDGGAEFDPPSPNEHVEAKVPVRVGSWAPPQAEAPGAEQPVNRDPIYITQADKEREREFDRDEQELELARAARAQGANAGVAPPTAGQAPIVVPAYQYLQPNYAILYLAIAVVVLLLVGKRKKKK